MKLIAFVWEPGSQDPREVICSSTEDAANLSEDGAIVSVYRTGRNGDLFGEELPLATYWYGTSMNWKQEAELI